MAKIGLYAGTFDPVHDGHLAFAMSALQACGLEKVIFLPEPQPRGKQGVTAIAQRVDMLGLATAQHPGLAVYALPDAQFTVTKTLPALRALFGDDITLLVGSDVAQSMPYWQDAALLFDSVQLAVGLRVGDEVPVLPAKVTIVPTSHAHVAASLVRQGASRDIPKEVREYINTNHLYVV